ncbi:MAG: hypothetical protein ABIJ21_08375 [Nanoarchaeota archaeon]
MIVEYCLNIDVQSKERRETKDIRGGSYGELEKIAKAAITIPCVTAVEIVEIDTGVHGNTFRRTKYKEQNSEANDYYTTEECFKEDLRSRLGDDDLFRLYTGERSGCFFIYGGGWIF